jgi:hypothetical protein
MRNLAYEERTVAYGDYITCCKCGVKLIYDGDRSQRNWWIERFGTEPEIECPNCKEWVGLTDEEIKALPHWWPSYDQMPALMTLARDIENSLKEKNI